MRLYEIIIIAVSLAMDTFTVSVCKGITMKNISYKSAIVISLYFGLFQSLMPLIGYLFGFSFDNISKIDHFVAFVLLFGIGSSMILESSDNEKLDNKIDFKTMIPLAIATSIDALAVGITFAFLKVNIIISSVVIGIITFLISFIGVLIGNKFGNKYGNIAERIGGILLILMGIRILFTHLGII
ncbi:MAG: manganese efflux pump [Bacilli bacterium]|nr:manganese efflux pump [Bacilli bacterium]